MKVKINNPKLKTLLEEAEKDGLCIDLFMEDSKYDFSFEDMDASDVNGCPTGLDDLKDYILQLIEAFNEEDNYEAYCRFVKNFENKYPNLKDSFTYVYWSYVPDDQTQEFEHLDDVIEFKYGKLSRQKSSNKKKNGPSTLKEIFPSIDFTKPNGLVIDDEGCCCGYDRKQHEIFLGEGNCLFIPKGVKTIEDKDEKIFGLLTFYDKCVVTTDLEDFGEFYACGGFHLFYIVDTETNKVVYSSKKDEFCSDCAGISMGAEEELLEVLYKYTNHGGSKCSREIEEENQAKQKNANCSREITEENEADQKNLKAGDEIYFGSNKGKRMGWKVLKIQDNKALIITTDIVRKNMLYHKPGGKITWSNCTLRKWLNNEFINGYFTQEERSRILPCALNNDNNPKYGTLGGAPTNDKVFLLSIDEMLLARH